MRCGSVACDVVHGEVGGSGAGNRGGEVYRDFITEVIVAALFAQGEGGK